MIGVLVWVVIITTGALVVLLFVLGVIAADEWDR